MGKWVAARKISQAVFLILFIYILWSTTYPLQGILPPETFFKLDPLIMFITSISERIVLGGIIFAVLMALLTLILGRFFCGWVCPFGTVIDIVGSIRKRRIELEDNINKRLRQPKFYILGIITILAIIGIQVAWILDPIVIMARFVSLNFIPFKMPGSSCAKFLKESRLSLRK